MKTFATLCVLAIGISQGFAFDSPAIEPNRIEVGISTAKELSLVEFKNRFSKQKSLAYFYLGSDDKYDFVECVATNKEKEGFFKISRAHSLTIKRFKVGEKRPHVLGAPIFRKP